MDATIGRRVACATRIVNLILLGILGAHNLHRGESRHLVISVSAS